MSANGTANGKSNGSYSDLASSSNNVVVRTTENWLELFLTTPEKYRFGHWKEEIADRSLSGQLLLPLWEMVSENIPTTVAPNVLCLAGLGLLGQAWYVIVHYGGAPTGAGYPVFAATVIIIFFALNSMVLVHADRIRQRTPLGDFFKYATDSAATVFLSVLTIYCLLGGRIKVEDGTDSDVMTEIQWYAVQSAQLVLFVKHLSAFDRQAGLRYRILSGPGEVIFTAVSLLFFRATIGFDWLWSFARNTLEIVLTKIDEHGGGLIDADDIARMCKSVTPFLIFKYGYYGMYLLAVTKTLLLKEPHGWSRFGLSASLLMRLLPAILYFHSDDIIRVSDEIGGLDPEAVAADIPVVGIADVICDGLFMAVLTSDLTLAKMGGREIHPWVVLMSLAAVFSHSTILALVVTYYVAVFADLCAYLNLPLLTTCRNVYCDGIYDLCHVGHKLLFQNALTFGNRLYVGVVGDKDANAYKRPPIMSASERCAEVEACKAVTKVIADAPCFGLTREFLDLHQIHVVAYGEEYLERYPDPKDDPYYRVPREMGIAKPLPRTQGLSTSDLIRRIQRARPADEKKSPT
jgi:cytidyltransferase-like protein